MADEKSHMSDIASPKAVSTAGTKTIKRYDAGFGRAPDMGRDIMIRYGGVYSKNPDPSQSDVMPGF